MCQGTTDPRWPERLRILHSGHLDSVRVAGLRSPAQVEEMRSTPLYARNKRELAIWSSSLENLHVIDNKTVHGFMAAGSQKTRRGEI